MSNSQTCSLTTTGLEMEFITASGDASPSSVFVKREGPVDINQPLGFHVQQPEGSKSRPVMLQIQNLAHS